MGAEGHALLLLLAVAPACTRNYYFGREAPPPLDGGSLLVPEDEGRVELRSVRGIRVSSSSAPGFWRPVSSDEMAQLLEGVSPDDLVEVRVDNNEVIWGEWALGSFGTAFAITFGLLAATVGFDSSGDAFDLDLGLGFLIATVVGLEIGLIGAAVGELIDGQPVDTRLHGIPAYGHPTP
jgi:hypothetical protein